MSSELVHIVLTILLCMVFLCVLLLPFLVKRIERDLELFLFGMGVIAIGIDTIMGLLLPGGSGSEVPALDPELIWEAVKDPLMITIAVLVAGVVFHLFKDHFARWVERIRKRMDRRVLVFIVIVTLGLLSSLISAIIAALLLTELVAHMKISRRRAIPVVVISCFSIGLGAALTPIGEPLSTIVISKLEEDFNYLASLLWPYVIPGIIALGFLGAFIVGKNDPDHEIAKEVHHHETLKEVFLRAGKVYLFVMALIFLGTGLNPLIEWYIRGLSSNTLYWVNILSAILDNATLASAEISQSMVEFKIMSALLALLIAGGMLIPGNIPNIISAGKLRISSREWAKVGVPLGLSLMVVYFLVLLVVSG